MHAFPSISVADARAVQGLAPRDEADVGSLRFGREVAGENDVRVACADELFEEARRGECLELALALEIELPVRNVVREHERCERLRSEDLGDKRRAGVVGVRGVTSRSIPL